MVHGQPVYTEYTENLYPPLEQHLSGSTGAERNYKMKKKKITSFNRWDSFAQCSEKFLHWYSENAAKLDYWFGGIVPSYT